MGVRYTLALTPADVGSRVVIRHRLPDGALTDVLGQLEAWDGDRLAIRRRDGSLTSVSWNDVVAAKVVPPAPARRPKTSTQDLLAIAARGWAAVESEWLGGWWLRAADGFTARANSVVPIGDPGIDLTDALDQVARWYAERNLPARIQTVLGSPLDDELESRGWTTPEHGLLQVADLDTARPALGDGPAADLRRGGQPTDGWLARYRPEAPLEAARAVLQGGPGVGFAAIGPQHSPLAVGRAVVEGDWVGIGALSVAETHRRQGHAHSIMRALLDFGAELGARRAYLQVDSGNDAALQLYAELGFATHHRFHFLSPGTGETAPASHR